MVQHLYSIYVSTLLAYFLGVSFHSKASGLVKNRRLTDLEYADSGATDLLDKSKVLSQTNHLCVCGFCPLKCRVLHVAEAANSLSGPGDGI